METEQTEQTEQTEELIDFIDKKSVELSDNLAKYINRYLRKLRLNNRGVGTAICDNSIKALSLLHFDSVFKDYDKKLAIKSIEAMIEHFQGMKELFEKKHT